MKQRSDQWYEDRAGCITASRLKDVLACGVDKWAVIRPSGSTLKVFDDQAAAQAARDQAQEKAKEGQVFHVEHRPGQPLKAFTDYAAELICERLTGQPQVFPDNYATHWGKDHEPYATGLYEQRSGNMVRECEFIRAAPETGLELYGASPDGLVGMEGQTEVKCPVNSVRHLRCFFDGIPDEHHPQMEGQLLATGRDWVDFISFDPRFTGDSEHLQLYVQRYTSQPELRAEILAGIARMEAYIASLLAQLPKAEP